MKWSVMSNSRGVVLWWMSDGVSCNGVVTHGGIILWCHGLNDHGKEHGEEMSSNSADVFVSYPGIGTQRIVCNFELLASGVLTIVMLYTAEVIHIVNPAVLGLVCVGEPLVVGRSWWEGEFGTFSAFFLAHGCVGGCAVVIGGPTTDAESMRISRTS